MLKVTSIITTPVSEDSMADLPSHGCRQPSTESSRGIKVGSRKSQLALIQTQTVIDALKGKCDDEITIVKKDTIGDKNLDNPLYAIDSKNLFTKELEDALLNGDVDFLVHSLKDLPTCLDDRFVVAAILKRDSPYDALVMHRSSDCKDLALLPPGSVIGTSSLRRIAQLKRKYPHLVFESIRGNLNTRFKKLDENNTYNAMILAVAGLDRMNMSHRITKVLEEDECMYAVSQGAICVECRRDDEKMRQILASINDEETVLRCVAERTLLKKMEGGCSVPIGTKTTIENNTLTIKAGIFSKDGPECIIDVAEVQLPGDEEPPLKKDDLGEADYTHIVAPNISTGRLKAARNVGIELAEKLMTDEGRKILAAAKQAVAKIKDICKKT
ncbi:porphobilinogen deaminase [Octopus sinensis]|uniref:hydroxymethylbilane synthase n=1 Tax=Octopus sinensis TaxID=2607531 RepID=A0A6P7T9H6_9MOLL|nr:porphobilinogen deaminase [Octopus sinensis]XP_036366754.1 porphobilinogen deaminase [Octopus sinensis]